MGVQSSHAPCTNVPGSDLAMNPYLKAIPSIPDSLDVASVFAPESPLRALIQQYNLLTYIDYEERLPDAATLKRDLKQRGLEGAGTSDVLLWILGQTFEVLPVPLTPDTGRFADIHFLANNKSVIETFTRSLMQDAGLLYHQLVGETPTLGAMRQVGGSIAYYRDMSNDHRRLFVLCRAMAVIHDYQDLFLREPGLMRQELVRERRREAIQVLEKILERQAASGAHAGGAPQTTDHGAVHQQASKAPSTPPAGVASMAASPSGLTFRAVDMPEWREFEKGGKDGLDWETVRRIFGAELIVRILLRRHDYKQLLAMMEARFISDPSDLRYCLRSMQKIVEHGDLSEGDQAAHGHLQRFIEAALEA